MAGSPFYVPNCGIPLLHNNPWKPNEVYWSSPPKTTSDNPQSAQWWRPHVREYKWLTAGMKEDRGIPRSGWVQSSNAIKWQSQSGCAQRDQHHIWTANGCRCPLPWKPCGVWCLEALCLELCNPGEHKCCFLCWSDLASPGGRSISVLLGIISDNIIFLNAFQWVRK
jgi:hypothetical protein